MSNKYNKKKNDQLGMAHGTACGQLKKELLFKFIKNSNMDTCYRCGKKIEKTDDLSIDHIEPWLDSENPRELFFELDNIAFSHTSCNYSNARKTNQIISPAGKKWCWRCKTHQPIGRFSPGKQLGKSTGCKECESRYRAEYRKRTGKR